MRREPAIAAWFLKLFCSGSEYDSVTGDLLEQYQAGRGNFWYCRQVLDIVCLALYSKVFRRPLVRKKRLPIGQGLGLVFLFGALSAAFLSVTAGFLVILLAIAFGGVCVFLWINAKGESVEPGSVEPVSADASHYHPGISMHHISVEGAVGLLFVIATVLIFALGIRAIREILLLTVPVGILGGGLLLYWHKSHPVRFQGLGLKARSRIQRP